MFTQKALFELKKHSMKKIDLVVMDLRNIENIMNRSNVFTAHKHTLILSFVNVQIRQKQNQERGSMDSYSTVSVFNHL